MRDKSRISFPVCSFAVMINARGVHPSEAMMHSLPLFQISSYFRKIFRLSKNFQTLTFSRKISRFSSAKISDDFFSPRPQILNFLLFSLFRYIFPLFCEIFYFPLLLKISPSPVLEKFTSFLHTLCVFRFPPALTMMHLCITQCTYWTPLSDFVSLHGSHLLV